MSTVVIEKYDISLEYSTDCLVIRSPDAPVRTLPLRRISKVVCLHNVQLTTQLLGQLHQRGIDFIVLNSRYVKHSFALYAETHQAAFRRCQQYHWQLDPGSRLVLAQALCRHKFMQSLRAVPEQTGSFRGQFEMALERLPLCGNEEQLRGLEGSVQRGMFRYWRQQLDPKWGFEQRLRRPPPDPVNALLSFAYTLVHHEAIRQAKRFGLDPDLGFYHRLAYSRQSLACDLMEPLRPQVEGWIVNLLQQDALTLRHFRTNKDAGCLLGKEGRLVFYGLFEQKLPQWRRSLGAHARWLGKVMRQHPTTGLEVVA